MTASLLAAIRLLRLLAHAAAGYSTIKLQFPRLSEAERQQRVQQWATEMLARMNISLIRQGPPQAGPVLLVSNHISWLDILVLHAAGYCRFVSKADVKHWPVLGPMATGAGTLYIERESRRDAMRVVHHMAEALARGEVVAAFPEGTTSDGTALLPFHANLIQAAIPTQTPVQPVGLRFIDAQSQQQSRAPCYINGEKLLNSLWRTLCAPRLAAVVTFGPPQTAGERNRRQFAADLRDMVEQLRQAPLGSPARADAVRPPADLESASGM